MSNSLPARVFQILNYKDDNEHKLQLRDLRLSDYDDVKEIWNNIYYEPRPKLIGARKTYARLGVVQWQMRRFTSFEEFVQQVEFFVDTVSGYKADLVLFPAV